MPLTTLGMLSAVEVAKSLIASSKATFSDGLIRNTRYLYARHRRTLERRRTFQRQAVEPIVETQIRAEGSAMITIMQLLACRAHSKMVSLSHSSKKGETHHIPEPILPKPG